MAQSDRMKTKPTEGEFMISKVTIRLPASLVERTKIQAIKQKRTLAAITAEALDAYLRKTPIGGAR